MPSNIIQINHTKELEWHVGASKMEGLIAYLDEISFRTSEDEDTTSSDASS